MWTTRDTETGAETRHHERSEAKAVWNGTPGRWIRCQTSDGQPFLAKQDDEGEETAIAWPDTSDASVRAGYGF